MSNGVQTLSCQNKVGDVEGPVYDVLTVTPREQAGTREGDTSLNYQPAKNDSHDTMEDCISIILEESPEVQQHVHTTNPSEVAGSQPSNDPQTEAVLVSSALKIKEKNDSSLTKIVADNFSQEACSNLEAHGRNNGAGKYPDHVDLNVELVVRDKSQAAPLQDLSCVGPDDSQNVDGFDAGNVNNRCHVLGVSSKVSSSLELVSFSASDVDNGQATGTESAVGYHDNAALEASLERIPEEVKPTTIDATTPQCPSDSLSRASRLAFLSCCFFVQLANAGYGFLFPVILLELVDYFHSTRAVIALIPSSFIFVAGSFGFVAKFLCARFGCGKMMMVSGAVCVLGSIIGSFAPSIPVLFVGVIINSAGISCLGMGSLMTVGQVFGSKGGRALSITSQGTGIALVVFPWLTLVLSETYTWRGAFLLIGCLYLHCIPIGLFILTQVERKLNRIMKISAPAKRLPGPAVVRSLCLDPLIASVCLGFTCTMAATPTTILFYVDIMADKGIDNNTASFLISLFGLASLPGRLAVAVAVNLFRFETVRLYVVLLASGGVLVGLLPWFHSYPAMLGLTVTLGLAQGCSIVCLPSVMVETAGSDRFPTGMAISGLLMAITSLILSPTAGALKDLTGSHNAMLFGLEGFAVLASLLLMAALFHRGCKRKS